MVISIQDGVDFQGDALTHTHVTVATRHLLWVQMKRVVGSSNYPVRTLL